MSAVDFSPLVVLPVAWNVQLRTHLSGITENVSVCGRVYVCVCVCVRVCQSTFWFFQHILKNI